MAVGKTSIFFKENTYVQRSQFSEIDLIIAILYYMKENGIRSINDYELCQQLYTYKENSQYKKLFSDIMINWPKNTLDLIEALKVLKIFGVLSKPSSSNHSWMIFIDDVLKNRVISGKSGEDILLVQNIAHQLSLRQKIAQEKDERLVIYGYNPNVNYVLFDGTHHNKHISNQLMTDSTIIKIKDQHIIDSFYVDDSNNMGNVQLGLTDTIVREVQIKDPKFITIQILVNSQVVRIELYTNIINKRELIEISNIAIGNFEQFQPMVETSPKIYKPKRI